MGFQGRRGWNNGLDLCRRPLRDRPAHYDYALSWLTAISLAGFRLRIKHNSIKGFDITIDL